VHLVGCIMRIYHDTRSSECQILSEHSTQPIDGQP